MVFGGHSTVLMRIAAVVSCPCFGTQKHATPFNLIFGRTNFFAMRDAISRRFPRRASSYRGAYIGWGDRSFHNHSYRNASSGSTFPARHTGIQHARSPTPRNNALTTINVAGSLGCTSNRKDLSTRDKTIASAVPMSTPPAISRNPSPKINLRMSFCCAPTALRIASSRRRETTDSESMP